jgi:hypothetical protein
MANYKQEKWALICQPTLHLFSVPCNKSFSVSAEDGGKTFKLLEDRYVILLAEGSFRDGRINQHRTKDSSSEPQALGIVTKLESKSKIYLKLHGSFMIASWIFAGSLGILLARYYKQVRIP